MLAQLTTLRTRVRACNDEEFAQLSRADMVRPFLEVVRSEATSGPFTGAALAALASLIHFEVLSSDAPDAQDAMCEVVEAVSNCRYAGVACSVVMAEWCVSGWLI